MIFIEKLLVKILFLSKFKCKQNILNLPINRYIILTGNVLQRLN